MTGSFLGHIEVPQRSSIISAAELIVREGLNVRKGMNFRGKGPLLSVFLVLPRESGYRDEWRANSGAYVYEGHDSTTVAGGALRNQVLMYEDGRLSDNGKFYKAAEELKSGVRTEPLQVQVYEKIDAGVWFDKGIFKLFDTEGVEEDGRLVYKFFLAPNGETGEERMLGATEKSEAWQRSKGRCSVCGAQADLHFQPFERGTRLLCGEHCGRKHGLL